MVGAVGTEHLYLFTKELFFISMCVCVSEIQVLAWWVCSSLTGDSKALNTLWPTLQHHFVKCFLILQSFSL